MDKWIMSFTQSLIRFVKAEMKAYRLYTVVPLLLKFVDNLTNWYVRMNRKRLKGDGGEEDERAALETLFSVLMEMIQIMSPFTPFMAELMYQNLKNVLVIAEPAESVHHLMLPDARESLIDESVERRIQRMQSVVAVGRILRDRKTLPLKYPLREVIVICKDESALEDIKSLESYILGELNVKELTTTTEKEKYGVQFKAEADIKALGLRLRGESKKVIAAIRTLTDAQLQDYQKSPDTFKVAGQTLEEGELRVQYAFGGDLSSDLANLYEADSQGDILVLLNIQQDKNLLDEGVAREVVNRIQKLRKTAGLVPTDAITVYYDVKQESDLSGIIKSFNEMIVGTLKTDLKLYPVPANENVVIEEKHELGDTALALAITRLN
jgi:isoleucyl-tRNA synthetase